MKQTRFNSVKFWNPKRTAHSMSHGKKLTCNMGDLIPTLRMKAYPGDIVNVNTEALVRLDPLLSPIMHNIDVYFHNFFTPYRLVMDKFPEYITGEDPSLQLPSVRIYSNHVELVKNSSLSDYLGCRTLNSNENLESTDCIEFNILDHRVYQLIYNTFYRDENLQKEINITTNVSGLDNVGNNYLEVLKLRKRNWKKDYFTSALTETQKGEPVYLPIGGQAPLIFNNYNAEEDTFLPTLVRDERGQIINGDGNIANNRQGFLTQQYGTNNNSSRQANIDVSQTHFADLTYGSSVTVNEFRRLISLQRVKEREALVGNRYNEHIYGFWGTHIQDYRIQNPVYLGGGKSPVVISEVVQMSETANTPQGNLAGRAISVNDGNGFNTRIHEYGCLMQIMSIMPEPSYQQGQPRDLNYRDRFDWLNPILANLGEQAVWDSEIYYDYTKPLIVQQDNQSDESSIPFGYQSRYAECTFMPSTVHGDFKDSLSFWHLGRIFENKPNLTTEFIECNPSQRIFATENITNSAGRPIDKLQVEIAHNIKLLRKIPKYGTPML